jgi:hypothetical protein
LKLIDHNALKTSEQKLIDLIVLNLNWKSVRKAIKSHFNIEVLKDITVDSGNLVILNNEIAFKLNMGPQTGVSISIDRSGTLIEISSSESLNEIKEKLSKPEEEIVEEQTALEDASVMTSEISAMISKINEANQPKTEG